jgi:hypothetical protein
MIKGKFIVFVKAGKNKISRHFFSPPKLWFGVGLLGGMLAWSCLNPFAPELDDGGLATPLITDQSTPEEVLINFKYAYIFKDSLLYADLLDSSFLFQYFDPNQGTSGIFDDFTREEDLRATGRFFLSRRQFLPQ